MLQGLGPRAMLTGPVSRTRGPERTATRAGQPGPERYATRTGPEGEATRAGFPGGGGLSTILRETSLLDDRA